jgi:hypothetical protein
MNSKVESNIRARVFISCGQQKESNEVKIARDIAKKLDGMGFEPYIAVVEQTLKGVKENIFRRLSESEYIIFVDFKRERLFTLRKNDFEDTQRHRGSLFSQQELAIATYLDIECMAFQEQGVKEDDGILRFIQANCIPFADRHLLADVVAQKVKEKRWEATWRNELVLTRENAKQYDDVDQVTKEGIKLGKARFYHIKVMNHHRKEIARNCAVYLEKLENLSSGEVITPELVEFKWKGLPVPTVNIPPQQFRYIDAFHVDHSTPKTIQLGINKFIVDYSGYFATYTLWSATKHRLSFVAFSDNFAPARQTFQLNVGNRLDDIEFHPDN